MKTVDTTWSSFNLTIDEINIKAQKSSWHITSHGKLCKQIQGFTIIIRDICVWEFYVVPGVVSIN